MDPRRPPSAPRAPPTIVPCPPAAAGAAGRILPGLLFLAGLAGAGPLPGQEAPLLERARWMAGCWEGTVGRTLVEEVWLAPRGGTMVGMGRHVRDGRTVEHESLRLFEEGAALVYRAHPWTQDPTLFRSTEVTDSTAVFENPGHDFPQRILYRSVGPDSLVARIEGERGGQVRGLDFRFARGRCDAAPSG